MEKLPSKFFIKDKLGVVFDFGGPSVMANQAADGSITILDWERDNEMGTTRFAPGSWIFFTEVKL